MKLEIGSDNSASNGKTGWEIIKRFLKDPVTYLQISMLVGLLLFSKACFLAKDTCEVADASCKNRQTTGIDLLNVSLNISSRAESGCSTSTSTLPS